MTALRLALAAGAMATGVAGGVALLSQGCGVPVLSLIDPPMAGACIRAAPKWAYYGVMSSAGGLIAALFLSGLTGARQTKEPRWERKVWSDRRDARKAGLMLRKKDDASRIRIVGKIEPERWGQKTEFLAYCDDAHVLVSGANRSGKGRGILVPTLLSYGQSVMAIDPKGEFLWGQKTKAFSWPGTSGWRATFSKVVYFCPTDRRSARFNFLKACRGGDFQVGDVQDLVVSIMKTANPNFFDRTAQEYMVAVGLHLLNFPGAKDVSIAGMREFLYRGDDGATEIILSNSHPVAVRIANSLFPAGIGGDEGDKMVSQRSDTYRTAGSFLWLFDDPVVAEVTSGECDFLMGDLMCLDQPMSLYIRMPPSAAGRVAKLIHLMISQAMRELGEFLDTDSRGREKKHQLLILADEFHGLGKMEDFAEKLPQVPGFGIETMLAVQTLNQIDEVYGEKNSIIDNCDVFVTFSSSNDRTMKRIADMVGKAPELRNTETKTRSKGGQSVSQGESRAWQYVMDMAEIRTLPTDKELVLKLGHLPWLVPKVFYDKEPDFKARLLPPVIEAPKAVQQEEQQPPPAQPALVPADGFWKTT